jgi:hypothetical protein
MARLPPDYDRRLFYFELTGGTHEDDSGFYQTGDLVVSKYDLAGRYGKKFRRIPFPAKSRSASAARVGEPGQGDGDAEPFEPVHGSDDDGLTRLNVQELRELAAEQGIELAVKADKAEIVEAIRRAWDDA